MGVYYLCASSLKPGRTLSGNLSRKAEGNGPLKPWQPLCSHALLDEQWKRCQLHPVWDRGR